MICIVGIVAPDFVGARVGVLSLPPPPPLVGTGSFVGLPPGPAGPEAGIAVGSLATLGSAVLPAVGAEGSGAGEVSSPLTVGSVVPPGEGGAGAGLVDAMAGIHPVFIDGFVTIVPQHRSGKMRVLAQLAETRSKILPDIPTSAEAGVPGFTSGSFMVVMAPVKTPQSVQRTLEGVTAKVVRDQAFQAEMLNVYIDPVTDSTPEKIRALIARERAKWGPIIKATGAKMQ